MGLIERFRLRQAGRRYAQRLQTALVIGYGASPFYTAGQIDAAVRRQKLQVSFVWLGYAAFLTEPDFDAATQGMVLPLTYEQVRTFLENFRASSLASSRWETTVTNSDWMNYEGNP
ncbi:MAG TPA: DUF6559 family protein [Aliidongia sp.]|uniref:DUF6559 family protein n=1 Tax=Aliidongia sp. TaxID=1914230 RepID=UPI002DDD20EF|nr:DUF6559 family protein [Aliidongia sp.]HEV2674383.1 DUF6559 family protein [Aliidongia sp.]